MKGMDYSGESISQGMERLFKQENQIARENYEFLNKYHDELEELEDIEIPELED